MDLSKTSRHGIMPGASDDSARAVEWCVPGACDGRLLCGIQDGSYPSKHRQPPAVLSPAAAFG